MQQRTKNDKSTTSIKLESSQQKPVSEIDITAVEYSLGEVNTHVINPRNVRILQTVRGNRFVQRLLSKNPTRTKKWPNFIQSKLLTSFPKVQRRVPVSTETDSLLSDPNPDIAKINLEGMKTAIKRMVKDLPAPIWIKVYMDVEDQLGGTVESILQQDDVIKLKKIIAIVKQAHTDNKAVEYPGTDKSFVAPTGSARTELDNAINTAAQTMMQIASGTHDQHLKDVFGNHATYGWIPARRKFFHAAVQLRRLFGLDKVGADRSGENQEMRYGGLTTFRERILLMPEVIDDPSSNKSQSIIIHEAMHAGNSNIHDKGYRSEKEFPKKSPREKFNSAAYYEEVACRVIPYNPIGGVFIPDTGSGSGSLTNFERARKKAVDQIRTAWILGINIFFLFKRELEEQNNSSSHTMSRRTRKTLLYNSTLLGLTFHKRYAVDRASKITTLDMMLAEGVTRLLSHAGQAVKEDSPTDDTILSIFAPELALPSHENDLAAYNVKHALEKVGPINETTERDIAMVKIINSKKNGLLNIQRPPPTLP